MSSSKRPKNTKPDHDSAYKRLFQHPRMVEDLLRSIIPEAWVNELDFNEIQDTANSLIGDRLQRREGDLIFRIPWKNGQPLYLCLLLEFQSKVAPWMAVRALQYVALVYDALIRLGQVEDKLPPVLSIVLYNGADPWDAAMDLHSLIALPPGSILWPYQPQLRFRLLDEQHTSPNKLQLPEGLTALVLQSEQSRQPNDFLSLVSKLASYFQNEEDQALWHDFLTWWYQVLSRARKITLPELPEHPKEAQRMLEEQARKWFEEIDRRTLEMGVQQGLQQGLQKGVQQGLELARNQEKPRLQHLLLKILKLRFGDVVQEFEAAISNASVEQLGAWQEVIEDSPVDQVRATLLGAARDPNTQNQ